MIIIDNKKTIYNSSIIYNKPFFYYSQAHTVGVDIDQSKYLKLNGIALISIYSKYTDVAQGIYRLRRLNQGHTINFIITDNKSNNIDNVIDLYKILNENQNNYVSNSTNLINFQTLKSDIRKNIIKHQK